jgi:hypothetical protein
VIFEADNTAVAAHMAELTKSYRKLDLPFGGDCDLCGSQCRYREATLSILRHAELQRDMLGAFQRAKDVERWQEAVRVAELGARAAGSPGQLDAAWCYFVHLARSHGRQELGPDNRAKFAAHYRQVALERPAARAERG